MFSTNGVDNFKLAFERAINNIRWQRMKTNENKLGRDALLSLIRDLFNHQGAMFFVEIELI
jgi:hypothetical protein